MSESDPIKARAEQIVAMLTQEEKDKVERKTTRKILVLATELAQREKKQGIRTAKAKMAKALIAAGKASA